MEEEEEENKKWKFIRLLAKYENGDGSCILPSHRTSILTAHPLTSSSFSQSFLVYHLLLLFSFLFSSVDKRRSASLMLECSSKQRRVRLGGQQCMLLLSLSSPLFPFPLPHSPPLLPPPSSLLPPPSSLLPPPSSPPPSSLLLTLLQGLETDGYY